MFPVLFEWGSIKIHSFGVAVALSVLLGVWLAARNAKKFGIEKAVILDYALYAAIVGIMGARIWEVIFGWSKFANNPIEALYIWNGGLSIQGSLFFGFLFTIWYTRKKKISFWTFADAVTPGVLLGQGLGRITSCVLAGGSYGAPTHSIFGITYPPGTPAFAIYGNQPLWPAEIFEGVWDLAIMAFILVLVRRKSLANGGYFLLYAILYSIGRFFLEYIRGDSLMIWGLKSAQLISILIILTASIIWYLKTRNIPSVNQKERFE